MTTSFRGAMLGGALLLAVSGYAAQASAQEAPAAEPAPAVAETPAPAATPAAPAAPGFNATIGKPAPGKGQVVFYREAKMMGAALSFKVRENDVELGKLTNGAYFVVDFDPGVHEFVVHSEAKDVTPIEVEAGEVYYLKFGISVGILAGRPNLSPSTQDAFDKLPPKWMKPSKWDPTAK